VKPSKFPHAIFVPNMSNNHFVINEAFLINIPSWALCDTLDNPTNVFFSIPSNSKSIKSALFFYLLSSKAVLYSRHRDTASFLFASFNKSKKLLSFTSLGSFLNK
jgi:ribosomal protein S2